MQAIFTGFDSAWSPRNCGAICDLVLLEDGSLKMAADPATVSWDVALMRARQELQVDLQVWAIDQPLVVINKDGCRSVEQGLASALMADFGCGAHSANLGLAAWAPEAPIWNLIRLFQRNQFVHDPMAVPGAVAGRFYFECYPHPAILGLLDLGRILKYKVHHKNQNDWKALLGHLRTLATAELPIKNICTFVREDLQQSKSNEDKLDSIISAYVAAYWWKYGVERSTMIGDLATGYIVTPHSARTFTALSRVFGSRMNSSGAGSVAPQVAAAPEGAEPTPPRQTEPQVHNPTSMETLPACDWVYFATSAKWSGTVTGNFVAEHKVIVRSIYNSAGIRIANVSQLKPGDRILLVHGGQGEPYRPLFSATIAVSGVPVQTPRHRLEVFSYIDESLNELLKAGGYVADPVVGRFTGIAITEAQDLRNTPAVVPRPAGNNTIWRWDEVFVS